MLIQEPRQIPPTLFFFYDVKKTEGEGGNVMGVGEAIEPTVQGTIAATMFNNEGKSQCNVILKEVNFVPNANFNIFSITKRTAHGWQSYTNSEAMWLWNEDCRLCFDIIIPTEKGCLYCMYLQRRQMKHFDRATVSAATVRPRELETVRETVEEDDSDEIISSKKSKQKISIAKDHALLMPGLC